MPESGPTRQVLLPPHPPTPYYPLPLLPHLSHWVRIDVRDNELPKPAVIKGCQAAHVPTPGALIAPMSILRSVGVGVWGWVWECVGVCGRGCGWLEEAVTVRWSASGRRWGMIHCQSERVICIIVYDQRSDMREEGVLEERYSSPRGRGGGGYKFCMDVCVVFKLRTCLY